MKNSGENQFQITSDIQAETHDSLGALSWVGMGQIQSAVQIGGVTCACLLDVGVNLKAGFRGIHMSRLYQSHLDYFLRRPLDFQTLNEFLSQALNSQGELSDFIAAKIRFDFMVNTKSLKSGLNGFRSYPLQIIVEKKSNQTSIFLQFEILYSSTCPQSAGLAVEVLKSQTSMPDRLPATPHAQRSRAVISLNVENFSENSINEFILLAEKAVQTPVQTAVKKADELEFAKLNAGNLMFCEDAARILSKAFLTKPDVSGFRIYCEHQESLHPHNASSVILHKYIAPEAIRLT
jgi:GTP cyclohydrolase I